MRKGSRILTGSIVSLALVATLALVVIAISGVTLTVRNGTSSEIENVTVHYGHGSFDVQVLKPHEERSRRVGKIGEGADFALQFDHSGERVQADFNVYFGDYAVVRDAVAFEIMNDLRVRVLYNGKQVNERHARPRTKP